MHAMTACGRKVALDAKFCAGCGAALGAKEKSVQSGTAPAQKGLTAKEWSDKGAVLGIKLDRPQEAIQCYDKALAIDPKNAVAWANKGAALYALDRYQEALQCFDKALKINPNDAMAWALKGGELTDLNRYQEAIQCFDSALRIDPQNAHAQQGKRIASK